MRAPDEVVGPGPAAGMRSVQRRAVRARRPGSASSRRRRVRAVRIVVAGRARIWVQRSRLCASAAITVQAALAVNVPGREVRERLVFEVADRELDDGVLAVLGLDERERRRCGWSRTETAPRSAAARPGGRGCGRGGRPAAGRRAWSRRSARSTSWGSRQASPTRVSSIARSPPGRAGCRRTPIENCQPGRSSRSNVFLVQNPESARSSFGPVAPARSTRAISSSQKRSIPREVFAEPFRRRMCSTSPVSARVARIGW